MKQGFFSIVLIAAALAVSSAVAQESSDDVRSIGEDGSSSARKPRNEKNPTIQKLKRDLQELNALVPKASDSFSGTPLRRQCNQAMSAFSQQMKTVQRAVDEMGLGADINPARHMRFYNDIYSGKVESGEEKDDDKDSSQKSRNSSNRRSERRERERERNRRDAVRRDFFNAPFMAVRAEQEDDEAENAGSKKKSSSKSGATEKPSSKSKGGSLYDKKYKSLSMPESNWKLAIRFLSDDIEALESLGFHWDGKRYVIAEDKADKLDFLEFQRIFHYYCSYSKSFRKCIENQYWKRDFEMRLKRMLALAPQLQAKLNRLDSKTGERYDLPTATQSLVRAYRWFAMNPEEKMQMQTKVGIDGGEEASERLMERAQNDVKAFLLDCSIVMDAKKEELAAESARMKEIERDSMQIIDSYLRQAGLSPELPVRVSQDQIRAFRAAQTASRRARFDALMKQQTAKGYSEESAGRRAMRSLLQEIESGALPAAPTELEEVAKRLKGEAPASAEAADADGESLTEESAAPQDEALDADAEASSDKDGESVPGETSSDDSASGESPSGETEEQVQPQFEDWD